MASPLDIIDCMYTVLHLPDELLGLSQSFLGDGVFGFIAPVCQRFNSTYLDRVSDKKTTTMERATSSISRARNYLEYVGDDAQDRAKVLQRMDNLVPCSGCDKMAVNGIVIHLPLQLEVGIFPSSNGRE
jgi:ribosomal protein L44E